MTDLFNPATDVGAFADQLLGSPLWPHQLDLVRSPARYRVVCAGRQVGKSRTLAVEALYTAATKRNALVLLVSAGETASRRLLEDCAALAGSHLLKGSVLDESKSSLTLSNGGRILSVPASQKQIRGWAVDLLIIDEAAFVDSEVWRAAEPAIVARPGSRVILCSTPWGDAEHYFRQLFRRGMDRPDEMVAAWHWPSTVSPLVDDVLVEHWRQTWTEREFATEVLAEFVDDAGAYFSAAELSEASTGELVAPDTDRALGTALGAVYGGVDWGMRRDAHALSVLAPVDLTPRCEPVWGVVYVEERFALPYAEWIDRLADLSLGSGSDPSRGFWWQTLAAETNGVGQMPAETLSTRLRGSHAVQMVTTTAALKEDVFGRVKVLLQTGRLRLPNDPRLLRQLRALEFEQLPGGGVRISVPERSGHDDLAMSMCLAFAGLGDRLDGERASRQHHIG